MRRALALAAALLAPAAARATDEIQVYNAEIAAPGTWTLQQHLNYTARRGARPPDYPGGLESAGMLNGTPELAYGVTPWWEIGAYAPFAARDDRFYSGGGKLRSLVVTPNAAERSLFYGVNVELSWAPERFSQSRWNLEVRPILGFRTGDWEFITNPIIETGLGGHAGHAFTPANRIAYSVRPDWQLGLENYSDLGRFDALEPVKRQGQTLFGVTDFRLGPIDVNFGVGRGLTGSSDRWVAKTIFGFAF